MIFEDSLICKLFEKEGLEKIDLAQEVMDSRLGIPQE